MNPGERISTIRTTWSGGDYAKVGELFEPVSERLVAALDEEVGLAGREVLDAATGTGNTALALARTGANVHAFDLTPELLAIAQRRAAEAGLPVSFHEGDLLAIPFPDDAFEVVVSTFGAFTADDHRACVSELVRVCRPGGLVVSTAWARTGLFATLREVPIAHHPELWPADLPDPGDWADADRMAAMVADLPVDVEVTTHVHPFWFPDVATALGFFEEVSGPVQRIRAGVAELGGDWDALRPEILERWGQRSTVAAGGIELDGVYGVARLRVHADG